MGDAFDREGTSGRLERSIDRHFLLRVDQPVPGLLSLYAFASDDGCDVHLQGYLLSAAAAEHVERERSGWQAWLERVAHELATAAPGSA